MRSLIAVAALGWIALCTPSLAQAPNRIVLAPESPKGVILLKVSGAPIGYSLDIAKYNRAEGELAANSFGGWAPIKAKEAQADTYMVRTVDPGEYIFQGVTQQAWWTVCFHADTLAFTVKPGEVLYLGAFDPAPHLRQLTQLAAENRHFSASSSNRHAYLDNIMPPAMTTSEDVPAEAKAFIAEQMPRVTAPVVVAKLEPATFATGTTIFGTGRVCGGYYAKGTKEKK